jgi:peptidoglycan hydrolase-like protein with peptidoglycan-binding domain
MKKFTTKVGALALGSVFAVSAMAAPMASAATIAEMQADIQAMIATLSAQLAALSTSETTSSATTTTNMYTHVNTLRVGSRGTQVAELQTCLNRLGNNTGVADGVFGPNTAAGVMSFQGDNGLVVDGVIGQMTGPKFETACAVTEVTTGTTVTTDASGTTTTTTSVSGDTLLVQAMASNDMTIGDSQKVIFTKLTLTAGNEDVDVSKIELEFEGSDRADLSKVTVLDATKSEIDSDTFNSDDEATVDADLTVEAGESVVIYIGGVTRGAAFSGNGLDIIVKVVSIETNGADVEGLPTMGAVHEVNAGEVPDKFDAQITRRESSAKIGENDVEIARINIDNNENSDQIVKAIKLLRVGSGDSDDTITGVTIEVDGENFRAEIDSNDDDEYTFDFGDGIVISDGDDVDFNVIADVNDDALATVAFDIMDVTIEDENGTLLSDTDGGDATSAGE